MLENPKCPRCGKEGRELTLIGSQARGDTFQADARRATTLYAYQCSCGMTFTHALWDERAINRSQ
jgi:hypothetical protein